MKIESGVNCMVDDFTFKMILQLEDLIEDNIDDVRDNRKELWEWLANMLSWFLRCADEDQLEMWADKRMMRIEKWTTTHQEEAAELNDPNENARLLKNIKKGLV